jgi:glycosyltransferase 2 family protein
VAEPHSLFASAGDEPRRRRIDDAVLLGAALVVVLAAALVAGGDTTGGQEAAAALGRLLGWLDPLWDVAYVAASVLVVVLLVAAVAARRTPLARDIVLATALALAGGSLLTRLVEGRWPELSDALWTEGPATYPTLRLAAVAAAALVALPDLTRPLRYVVLVVVALATVASLVEVAALPAQVLGGLALGLAVGAAVRLAFGSSAGFPDERRVLAGLAALGVPVTDVWRDARQRGGVARYRGVAAGGGPLAVAVYGRDARDAQFVARLWRMLWYRDPGPAASLTRREQVEHEGLMLFTAARAGVPVPDVVAAGTVGTGDALLVTDQPEAPPLAALAPAAVSDGLLDQVWDAAGALRNARLGHGRLNAATVVVTGNGILVTDLAAARINATDGVLATDVAELLVSCSVLVGEVRAVGAARRRLGDEALVAALPFVQRAALSPGLRDVLRDADLDVDRVREEVVAVSGGTMPQIAEIRRVSLRGVLLMALTAFAAYLLLGQLADIGLDTLVDAFSDAVWSWAVLALALAQLALVTDAVATVAAVGRPLPLGPTTILQSAVKFINLTVPSTAGKIALTMRYLERQGVERAVALTQGSIDGLAGFVVQALVLLVVVPIVGPDLSGSGSGSDSGSGNLGWVLLAVVAGCIVLAALATAVPALRRRVWPFVHAALTNLHGLLTSPGRLVRLVAANVASQLVYALTLGASLRAFDGSASLAELLLVNTGVTLLSGIIPVPGGIGVAEAGLTAGLTAVGVPQSTALAAALLHRMCTYYLPPVWGWFSLRWLTRRGYV